MIAEQMHRLATRLGIRDGEAYTVVTGLVVALVLAAVGLPGVFRGFDQLPFDAAAGAPQPASIADPVADGGPTDVGEEAPPPSLPARTPAVAPGGSSPGPGVVPAPAPTTTAPPLLAAPDRAVGDLDPFADVPAPGSPDGMAVGPDGTVYVAGDSADGASTLWAFSADGDLVDSWEAADQPATRGRGLTGVAVAADGTVLVTDAATARVLRIDGDALRPVATADDLAACGLLPLSQPCESGLIDSPPLLTGIAVGPDGTVVVADRAQGVVWRLDGDDLAVLAALDDRLPADGPVALSFLTDAELIVAVGARSSSFPPGLPAVFRIRIGPDGTAEAPELVADLEVGETPGDVVVGASGRAYVTVPSAGLVIDLGVDQGDRIDIDVAAADPGVPNPTGVAIRDRSLLLSDPSDQLFDLAVNDRPVTRGPS